MARNSLLCADVPLRNYSLTHSLTHLLCALGQLNLAIDQMEYRRKLKANTKLQ